MTMEDTKYVNLFEAQVIAERESKEAETEQERNAWKNALKSFEEQKEFFNDWISIEWITTKVMPTIDNDLRVKLFQIISQWRKEHDNH